MPNDNSFLNVTLPHLPHLGTRTTYGIYITMHDRSAIAFGMDISGTSADGEEPWIGNGCSGDLTIHADYELPGELQCKSLIVLPGCKLKRNGHRVRVQGLAYGIERIEP